MRNMLQEGHRVMLKGVLYGGSVMKYEKKPGVNIER